MTKREAIEKIEKARVIYIKSCLGLKALNGYVKIEKKEIIEELKTFNELAEINITYIDTFSKSLYIG